MSCRTLLWDSIGFLTERIQSCDSVDHCILAQSLVRVMLPADGEALGDQAGEVHGRLQRRRLGRGPVGLSSLDGRRARVGLGVRSSTYKVWEVGQLGLRGAPSLTGPSPLAQKEPSQPAEATSGKPGVPTPLSFGDFPGGRSPLDLQPRGQQPRRRPLRDPFSPRARGEYQPHPRCSAYPPSRVP